MKYSVSLKRNHEFRRLYNKGTSAATPSMVIYCRRNGKAENRLGMTVSAKLGNAVCRNRIRRRLKETYRVNEDKLRRGYDVVIVGRLGARNAPWKALNGEFRRICGKLGLLDDGKPALTSTSWQPRPRNGAKPAAPKAPVAPSSPVGRDVNIAPPRAHRSDAPPQAKAEVKS